MSGRRQMRAVGQIASGPLVWMTTGLFRFLSSPFSSRDPRAPAPSTGAQIARIVGQCLFVVALLGGLLWIALTLAL